MSGMKIVKRAIAVVVFLVFAAQFVRPEKTNPPTDEEQRLEAHALMTASVSKLLNRACYDCHSHRTVWPWYSNVAPVSWFVIDHVNHGRRHLNFSKWGRYQRSEKNELLEDIANTVKSGEMPLESYNLVHPEARLTDEERRLIHDWAQNERRRLAANKADQP